jgi:hypothetical protein
MATVNKDFRVKHGLVVEGANATVDGSDIITEDAIVGGTQTNITVTYNPTTKVVDFVAENGVADSTTDDLVEGTTNKYFTDERAQDAVGEMFSGNTESGISVTYDDATNKVNFNVNDPLITISGDVDGSATMTNLGDTEIQVTLDTVNSNVGSFGGQTKIPTFTVNGKGLLTAAGEVDVATNLSIAGDTGTDTVSLLTDTLTFEGGTGITSTVSNNKIKVDIDSTVVTLDGTQTLTNKTMGDDLLMDGFQISGLGTPNQADHAATKAYVDAVSEGLHIHESARVAIEGNISIATGLENGDTAGGVTLVTGDRVLVKDQTTISENGIYVVQASGQALRATDFDTAMEVDSGDFVFVTSGTYANTGWVQTLKPATIGTDPLSFTQFSGAGTFLSGNGLNLDGNVFEIDETITATRTFASGEVSDHSDLTTGVHGVTGDVVGTSDTQDLSNKRIVDTLYFTDGVTIANEAEIAVKPTTHEFEIKANYGDLDLKSLNDDIILTPGSGKDVKWGADVLATQNYVDNQTTTDIAEGTNLYFTDTRAVDALEAVVPDFTAVEINSLAKQVAATSSSLGSVPVTAYSFAKASYRTAKFIVKIDNGTHNEVTEVLLSLDSSDNIAITEYAIVGTNGSRGTITADISGTDVRLRVDPVNDSTINVVGTLLA